MSWRVPSQIPLPENFQGFDPRTRIPLPDFHHYQRHLPHWRLPGVCYLTTFRLNDSIPRHVLGAMKAEMKHWKQRLLEVASLHEGRVPEEEQQAWAQFQRNHLRKLESLLDEGRGACLLRSELYRRRVEEALHHFEGQRCQMLAFTLMPNHVHVLCRLLAGHALEEITGSWKRYSSAAINGLRDMSGKLWQQETFDRIIRDADHFQQAVRYIAKNPLQAKLRHDEATVWFNDTIMKANGWTQQG